MLKDSLNLVIGTSDLVPLNPFDSRGLSVNVLCGEKLFAHADPQGSGLRLYMHAADVRDFENDPARLLKILMLNGPASPCARCRIGADHEGGRLWICRVVQGAALEDAAGLGEEVTLFVEEALRIKAAVRDLLSGAEGRDLARTRDASSTTEGSGSAAADSTAEDASKDASAKEPDSSELLNLMRDGRLIWG